MKDDLEVIQNNALRIIYKRSIMDHVEVESLRDWAGVKQIKVRLNELLNSYYEKALTSHNPLLIKLFEEYISELIEKIMENENLMQIDQNEHQQSSSSPSSSSRSPSS